MKHLSQTSAPFLEYLDSWVFSLPTLPLKSALSDPAKTVILSVDVINGFCKSGPLSSKRISRIIGPIKDLFKCSWDIGLRDILLLQDNHEPDAVEFNAFPPHCVRGTDEAHPVSEISSLPFFDKLQILPKNSISSSLNTSFPSWLEEHTDTDTFIIVGDCTDLCVYQLAMYLRVGANALQKSHRIILPLDCVDTYNMSLERGKNIGAFPHPGDLMHAIFAYHMALNSVEVVKKISE
jgi:nicotinamidase-related amidase